MSNYLHLDSFFRNIETYPNPANYAIETSDLIGFNAEARTVRPTARDPRLRPEEFSTTLNLTQLIMPYYLNPTLPAGTGVGQLNNPDNITANLANVYVDIHSDRYNDSFLTNTIRNSNPDIRFIATFGRVQFDNFSGTPVWSHFSPLHMPQVLRFRRNYPMTVRIFDRFNATLPIVDFNPGDPDRPERQTLMTYEIVPYIRDDEFSNHLIEPRV